MLGSFVIHRIIRSACRTGHRRHFNFNFERSGLLVRHSQSKPASMCLQAHETCITLSTAMSLSQNSLTFRQNALAREYLIQNIHPKVFIWESRRRTTLIAQQRYPKKRNPYFSIFSRQARNSDHFRGAFIRHGGDYSINFPLSPGRSICRCTQSGALPFDNKRL